MRSTENLRTVGDRREDQRIVINAVHKPPVLRRSSLRLMCILCLGVITYGTLGPLGHTEGAWIVAVDSWQWVPPIHSTNLNDVITNFLVYIPVGIAFRLLIRRRRLAGWPDFLLALALSTGLSYVTELLQQVLPARTSSIRDVHINTFAAFVGCLLAVPTQRLIRRIHEYLFVHLHLPWRPWTALWWLSASFAVFLTTIPWDLSRPTAAWGFDQPLTLADARRVALFATVGLFAAGAGLTRDHHRLRAIVWAFVKVATLAVALESSQVILGAHVCSARDGTLSVLAALGGALLATRFVRPPADHMHPLAGSLHDLVDAHAQQAAPTSSAVIERLQSAEPLYRLVFGVLVALIGYVVLTSLWSLPTPLEWRSDPTILWIPFSAQFDQPFARMITVVLEQVTLYATITLLCLFLTRGRGEGLALLMLTGLIGALEVVRGFAVGTAADTTALLLVGLGWAVMVRIWRVLQPPHAVQGVAAT